VPISFAGASNRTSNLALVTQNVQWVLVTGASLLVSAYLQVVRH
jgi:hypothetical protein